MITLVLGGARSGKSAVAESLAARAPSPVTYVATLVADPDDEDLAARLAAHRARRPPAWAVVELSPAVSLVDVLRSTPGTVLVDSLGAWVAGTPDLAPEPAELCLALRQRPGDALLVSDEVGLGVHPSTELGRRFRDRLGEVNRAVAAVADDVLLVVAGRTLSLGPAPVP